MRSLSVILIAILLPVTAITICSFTVKEFKKDAFVIKCYEYSSSIANQSLNPASPDFINQTQFENTTNWILRNDDPSSVCPGGEYICRICFDDAQVPGFRVSLDSREEAVQLGKLFKVLKAVFNWIVDNGPPPSNTPITVNIDSVVVNVHVYSKPNE